MFKVRLHALGTLLRLRSRQYRDTNGDPIYLQRPILVGEIITGVFGGRPSGRFHGKMIMLDLDAWVANDVSPPVSSSYTVTDDNQVELADTVAQRGGVQPLVTLAVTAADECDVQLCTTHSYTEPGTRFAAVRVTAQRDGDADAGYTLIQNLARVRVVVN